MKEWHDIREEDLPCYYELSWEPQCSIDAFQAEPSLPGMDIKSPAIILRTHSVLAVFFQNLFANTKKIPFVEEIKSMFGLSHFQSDLSGNFGFDDALINIGQRDDGFIEFVIPLPGTTKKGCSFCNGTGYNEWTEQDCLMCNGTGKKNEYNWHKAWAISASLSMFFGIADLAEEQIIVPALVFKKQLFLIKMGASVDNFSRTVVWLNGTFNTHLCNWFRQLRIGAIPEMVEAMKTAWDCMQMQKNHSEFDFYASIDYPNGWLNIHCPGNACGLNPCHNAVKDTGGYEFADHNVDTPFQQLALLAGLAALHDKARQAGVGVN